LQNRTKGKTGFVEHDNNFYYRINKLTQKLVWHSKCNLFVKFDALAISRKSPFSVIPAEAGIQSFQLVPILWTPVFTGVTTSYETVKFVFFRDPEKNCSFIGQGVVFGRGWAIPQPYLNFYATI